MTNPPVTAPRINHYIAGARASLPVLLGIVPFGVITGVAMVASGIPPLVAMLMSLRYVPAPELLVQHDSLAIMHNERLLAGVVAIAVAWRWRMTFATIIAGLLALHLFDWLL